MREGVDAAWAVASEFELEVAGQQRGEEEERGIKEGEG